MVSSMPVISMKLKPIHSDSGLMGALGNGGRKRGEEFWGGGINDHVNEH